MKKIILFSLLAMLSGCAQMMALTKEQTCSTDAGYAQGINDARESHEMQSNYAEICDTDRAQINQAYRSGYTKGMHAHPINGERTEDVVVVERGSSSRQCIKDNFSHRVCGYGCTKDVFDHIYCGKRPGDHCVTNQFNNTKCGRGCHIDTFGNITCREERYSHDSDRP